ncbi:hypothetical protein [Verrucosispora sp. WMMD1129]|uniref:hypothetical protein n=1 Tax=Verrucosispora sp. WMMD1129 TaxID=3016093 RepID=UPI00249C7384|nr:hypothetical protein [Verrucosispora sp. WMMD1129]WFE47658.1 hypothetical protein O7624_26695 [Verrucosispora sp. WMMD1129]
MRATARLVLAVVLGFLAVVVAPGGVVAAPTPEPSPLSESCPAPSVERPVTGEDMNPQVNWCVPWVRWRAGTGWLTDCGKAASAVDQEHCDAVSLTVQSPPPEGVVSVLDDRLPPPGAVPVRCERFGDRAGEDPANAGRWSAKQSRCEALRDVIAGFSSLRASVCGELDVACQVGEQVRGAARSGFEGLADIAVAGFAWALGKLATLVFAETSVVADEPFYGVYNDISGVLIIVVLLFFVFSTAINGLRLHGPGPLSSLGGLVRAMFGIAFAGGIAFLLMAAWDEATVALIRRNQQRDWQPSMWVEALNALTADTGTVLFAFLVAVVGVFGLVLVFLMLLFRSLLAAGAAVVGAMAMTGQVMQETRGWGRKWFWTCNALASSKFFIAAFWIYGTRSSYESDHVINVLRGLFIIVLMVIAPWILLRLMSMWDGYLADIDARGFAMSAVSAVGLDAAAQRLTNPAGGGDDAAAVMRGNADTIPTTPGAPTGHGAARSDALQALDRQVGERGREPDGPDGGQGGGENAQEADGVERDSRTAQGDVSRGQLTVPGDPTGQQGALPVVPGLGSGQAGPPGSGGLPQGGSSTGDSSGRPGPTPTEGPAPAGPAAGGTAGGAGAAGGAAADIPIVPL